MNNTSYKDSERLSIKMKGHFLLICSMEFFFSQYLVSDADSCLVLYFIYSQTWPQASNLTPTPPPSVTAALKPFLCRNSAVSYHWVYLTSLKWILPV